MDSLKQTRPIIIVLNAVIVAVTEESPRVLTVRNEDTQGNQGIELFALPFGPLDAEKDRTMEKGLRGWVREQTGLELGYVEQLYTFGDRHRDPTEKSGGPRVVSVAYLALTREGNISGSMRAQWMDCYGFLPWEDWRKGKPAVIENEIVPRLLQWCEKASTRTGRQIRRERMAINFGPDGATWDGEKVLERFEMLYEAGIAGEAFQDDSSIKGVTSDSSLNKAHLGRPMALDHRRMLATALGRIRGKIKYRPVVFELIAPTFTLFQLQTVAEALAGLCLHKQNFRRLVENGGLVEGTGQLDHHTGGRPAELFRFRREVLRERRAPGVGLPSG